MKKEDQDITSWKESLKDYDNKRKNPGWTQYPQVKHYTMKEAKLKELEYNPILAKFSDYDRNQEASMKDNQTWLKKNEAKMATTAKYDLEYDPVNLQQRPSVSPKKQSEYIKPRVVPVNQVHYNIVNNEKLGDEYFKNIKYNGALKKEYIKKPPNVPLRDYNILNNKYWQDDDAKKNNEKQREEEKIHQRYKETHVYNPLIAEYYDREKEKQFSETRTMSQMTHGSKFVERLPPSIRYRESVSLDPTKEVPEETRKVDLKKENAKARYKTKYKLEGEYRERSELANIQADERAKNRIYDGKFYEHLKKGYDIINQNVVDAQSIKTKPRESLSTWEKVQATSNLNKTPVDDNMRSSAFKSNLFGQSRPQPSDLHTMNTDPNFMNSESTPIAKVKRDFHTAVRARPTATFSQQNSVDVADRTHNSSASQLMTKLDLTRHKASAPNLDVNKKSLGEIYKSLDLKNPYARSQEPVYNLADKYNALQVKPRYTLEAERNIPGVHVNENQMRFSMIQTGGFKRLEGGA